MLYTERLIKFYISENIKLKTWQQFIKDTINNINKKLDKDIKYEILYQGLLRFYTYVIGITQLTTYTFFPNTGDLIFNKNILISELTFYQKLTDFEIDIILKIISKNNHASRKIIKDIMDNMQIPKEMKIINENNNNNIKFNIICDNYNDNVIINKKHYDRLKKMYNGMPEFLDYWICLVLLRYRFYGKDKESICLCVDVIYDFIKEQKVSEKTLEIFAGSLNSALPNYCSLFYDIEQKFGSKGSFFLLDINKCDYNIIVSNPPYIAEIVHMMFEKLLDYLNTCKNSTVFISVPDWRSKTEYSADIDVQINIGLKERKRYDEEYAGYSLIKNSKYFKYVIAIGNLSYYNFFADSRRNINVPTLILVLSNSVDNGFVENFKEFILEKV